MYDSCTMVTREDHLILRAWPKGEVWVLMYMYMYAIQMHVHLHVMYMSEEV